MDTNKTALNQCLELSKNISKLGLGINSKRSACELFASLVQSSTDLGALVTAVDYIPSIEYRVNITVEAMKAVSKVIYMLNVANASDMFLANDVADSIASAVKVSELLNAILAEYSKKPEQKPEEPAKPKAEEKKEEEEDLVEDDEDGFDEPFEG